MRSACLHDPTTGTQILFFLPRYFCTFAASVLPPSPPLYVLTYMFFARWRAVVLGRYILADRLRSCEAAEDEPETDWHGDSR